MRRGSHFSFHSHLWFQEPLFHWWSHISTAWVCLWVSVSVPLHGARRGQLSLQWAKDEFLPRRVTKEWQSRIHMWNYIPSYSQRQATEVKLSSISNAAMFRWLLVMGTTIGTQRKWDYRGEAISAAQAGPWRTGTVIWGHSVDILWACS